MEKHVLLESIEECVEACEALATACTTSPHKHKICGDCLDGAIDCADGGMILIMKLSADDNELHRNLINQFIVHCKACITMCAMHNNNEYAHLALWNCQKSIMACKAYIEEHLHTDQFYYIPNTSSAYAKAEWKHLLVR